MKGVLAVIVVLGIVAGGIMYAKKSVDSFDPTTEGKAVRAKIADGAMWSDVLQTAGEPSRWRDGPSAFDFNYKDRYGDDTRTVIASGLENGAFPTGFSFLYRFGNECTFAVNFSAQGKVLNIQDMESTKDLTKGLGG